VPISIELTSPASSEDDAILPSKRSNLLCTPWALGWTRCSVVLANSQTARSTPPVSGAADPARNADDGALTTKADQFSSLFHMF
jgi:hypothetical protein